MLRKIITIDTDKCNGCGLCASACHEGAIGMVGGKAKLLKEDYCDGLGDCLPVCPTGAIRFEEREAAAYDEAAVQQHLAKRAAASAVVSEDQPEKTGGTQAGGTQAAKMPDEQAHKMHGEGGHPHAGGCPGRAAHAIQRQALASAAAAPAADVAEQSELAQWPLQIQLVPVNAPYFDGAKLLVAADCTAFAYRQFHRDFMQGHITLVGCPKLDMVEYAEKLTEILRQNTIRSVTVVRMEVPCCGGLENAVKQALVNSGKMIPWQVATITTDGRLLQE